MDDEPYTLAELLVLAWLCVMDAMRKKKAPALAMSPGLSRFRLRPV